MQVSLLNYNIFSNCREWSTSMLGKRWPLYMAVSLCFVFDCIPFVFDSRFLIYLPFMLILPVLIRCSRSYPSILGLSIVALCCSPINSTASIPFYSVMAGVTAIVVWPSFKRMLMVSRLSGIANLFLAGIIISTVSWFDNPLTCYNCLGLFIEQIKCIILYPGIILLLPVILATVIQRYDDYLLAQYIVVCSSILMLAIFFFLGHSATATLDNFGQTVMYALGAASANFLRTQVCIVLAVLTVASFALAISAKQRLIVSVMFGLSALGFYIMVKQASVGSLAACVTGLLFVVLLSLLRSGIAQIVRTITAVLIGITLFTVYAFTGSNMSVRLEEKRDSTSKVGDVDRVEKWKIGIDQMLAEPYGIGWSLLTRAKVVDHPHNDFLVFGISYGPLGLLGYAAALLFALKTSVSGFWALGRAAPSALRATYLVGAGSAVVIMTNSMTDHLVANTWYYGIAWTIISISVALHLRMTYVRNNV